MPRILMEVISFELYEKKEDFFFEYTYFKMVSPEQQKEIIDLKLVPQVAGFRANYYRPAGYKFNSVFGLDIPVEEFYKLKDSNKLPPMKNNTRFVLQDGDSYIPLTDFKRDYSITEPFYDLPHLKNKVIAMQKLVFSACIKQFHFCQKCYTLA